MNWLSWIIWVGPECTHKWPHKREVKGDLTGRRRHTEKTMWRWKQRFDWWDHQLDQQPPEAEKQTVDSPLRPPEGGKLCPHLEGGPDIPTPDFWIPEVEDNKILLFSIHQVSVNLLQQPQKTNTVAENNGNLFSYHSGGQKPEIYFTRQKSKEGRPHSSWELCKENPFPYLFLSCCYCFLSSGDCGPWLLSPSSSFNEHCSSLWFFFLMFAYLYLALTSLVAQMVKRLPTMWETQVRSLGWEDPLGKEMAPHSSTLA